MAEEPDLSGHGDRIDDIAGTLFAIAAMDFERRAAVVGDDGALDGLAGAANMLAEEMGGYFATLRETEQRLRSSEDQLRQAQKMEAVGRLAGGVAHDFNNMLSVILCYSEMLLGTLDTNDPARADVMQVKDAGERAARLTRQLLLFSRQQVVETRSLDLNEVVGSLSKMLGRVLGEDIGLKVTCAPGLGSIRADTGLLEQIIMNLVVNARDAMPTGGQLTIETASVDLDAEYARDHLGVKPGPYAMLAVTDTGHGMDRETQARIFEPFFTTKERGKGTGLGLSTVFGIVQQLGGSTWVYSEPEQGCCFKIYLPRTSDDASAGAAAVPRAHTDRGDETVLLVEDEEPVRTVTAQILRRAGYRVLEASNAGEALLACEAHSGPIELLVSDVVMPKVSGPVMAARLTSMRPSMRVLFVSGYTDEAVVNHGLLESGASFLQKPLTPSGLRRKVREVLDGS